jgi:hypothetical protein
LALARIERVPWVCSRAVVQCAARSMWWHVLLLLSVAGCVNGRGVADNELSLASSTNQTGSEDPFVNRTFFEVRARGFGGLWRS